MVFRQAFSSSGKMSHKHLKDPILRSISDIPKFMQAQANLSWHWCKESVWKALFLQSVTAYLCNADQGTNWHFPVLLWRALSKQGNRVFEPDGGESHDRNSVTQGDAGCLLIAFRLYPETFPWNHLATHLSVSSLFKAAGSGGKIARRGHHLLHYDEQLPNNIFSYRDKRSDYCSMLLF